MCLDQLFHAGLEDRIISFFVLFSGLLTDLISPLSDGLRERTF